MTIEDRVRDSLRAHAERVSASLDSWSEIERRLDPGSTQPSVRQRVLVAAVALTITAGAVLLVVRAFGSGSTRPASIAPGDTLLFSVRNSWFPDSNVFALSGGSKDVTPYLAGPTSDVDASISPDASSVAFSRDGDIFVMGLDGSGLLQVTHDERNRTIYDEYPVWSPDGTNLAFERDGRRHRIWIVGSDGS